MRRGERAGFTLIELMIVVAILGILASVAIPSFMTFVRQAKAAEAYDVLKTLYGHAATYYIRENFTVGINGVQSRSCTVSSSDNKVVPSAQKVIGNYSDPGFHALGFTHEQSYFRFELINHHDAAGECSVPPSTPDVYAIRAIGDLDDDGEQSLIELATASDDNNELYHARSFYLSKETE